MQESIIHRARQGDQRAFQQVIEEYHSIAWRTARVLLTDQIVVEDTLQEAWMDVWRSFARFDERQAFRPWLLTIVANRCRMELRRRNISTLAIEDVDEDFLMSSEDVIKEILKMERGSELQNILALLPVKQQRILELHFFAELELSEIALILEVPIGTVKSRLHRALKALRASKQIETFMR